MAAAKKKARRSKAKPPTKSRPRRPTVEIELEDEFVMLLDDDGHSARELTPEEREAVRVAIKQSDLSELERYVLRMRDPRGVRLRQWAAWQMLAPSGNLTPWPDA